MTVWKWYPSLFRFIFRCIEEVPRMGNHKSKTKTFIPSSLQTTKERDNEIAKATTAAIAANGSSSLINNTSVTNGSIPKSSGRPPRNQPNDIQHRCLMLFPTSGHMGFDIIKTSDDLPPIETIREMIAYETRLRLSEPVQELMEFYHTDESALT